MKKALVLSGGDKKGPDGHDFTRPVVVTADDIEDVLGPRLYHTDTALEVALPGVATGMACSSAGGELLFIESSCYFKQGSRTYLPSPRDGNDKGDGGPVPARGDGSIGVIHVTGSLGDVMKESCHIALSWLRSNTAMILSKSA